MKTYLKHPYEKPLTKVFYAPSDVPNNFPSRVDYRQRIVQPSTKEQQRLLSSSHSPRFQHVHYGKYGIKPIWPSDESECEAWERGRKSSKNRWSSFSSLSPKSDRNQCVRSKSDSEKKFVLPSRSTLSYVTQEDGSKLMLASFSLLLLLLIIYVFYRRRCIKINDNKLNEQRRRHSLEESLLNQDPTEYRLPSVRKLPTIAEENLTTLSPLNSSNKLTSTSNTTNIISSPTVTDTNDSRNSSSTTSCQQKPSTNDTDKIEKTVQKVLPSKEKQLVAPDQTPQLQQPSKVEQPTLPELPSKSEQVTTPKPAVKEESKITSSPSKVEQPAAPKSAPKEQPKPASTPSKSEQAAAPKLAPKEEPATTSSPPKVEQPSTVPKPTTKEQPKSPSAPSKAEQVTPPKLASKDEPAATTSPSKVEQPAAPKSAPKEQPKSTSTPSKAEQVTTPKLAPKEEPATTSSPPKVEQPSTVPKPASKEQTTTVNPPSKVDQSKVPKPTPKEQSAPSNAEQPQASKETSKNESAIAVPSSNQRRRSRFENDSKDSTNESTVVENLASPPVMMRKISVTHENVIKDDFTSIEEINNAVKEVGLDHSQLIFGIDYTISNLETGRDSFNGYSLHHIEEGMLNPYQSVISVVGRTLEKYDADTLIPAFGFGDRLTLDRKIFPLRPDGSYCKGFRGVLEAYNEITPKVRMSGPTNFAPLIREAIKIVKKTGEYHILVIVADGQVTNERQTKDAIVEASNYPLSIVMIGVGDGPWDMMEEFDDSLPTRQFDNFQFVEYNHIIEASANQDSTFALRALMEIPAQYAAIKKLGLLGKKD